MGELKNVCRNIQKDIEQALKKESDAKRDAKTPAKANNEQVKEKIYQKNKDAMQATAIRQSPQQLTRLLWKEAEINTTEENKKKITRALVLIENLGKAVKENELRKAASILEELEDLEPEKKGIKFQNKLRFHEEIKEFMDADLDELEKTFNAGCFRSSIIICGRLLETALHRKFYEKTGNDILEKHPEIGLGKIIAKLEELNVEMPPGLTQQIHLINQARIYSVHKKKEAFMPSREQAYAVMLYTIDVLKKLL